MPEEQAAREGQLDRFLAGSSEGVRQVGHRGRAIPPESHGVIEQVGHVRPLVNRSQTSRSRNSTAVPVYGCPRNMLLNNTRDRLE